MKFVTTTLKWNEIIISEFVTTLKMKMNSKSAFTLNLKIRLTSTHKFTTFSTFFLKDQLLFALNFSSNQTVVAHFEAFIMNYDVRSRITRFPKRVDETTSCRIWSCKNFVTWWSKWFILQNRILVRFSTILMRLILTILMRLILNLPLLISSWFWCDLPMLINSWFCNT